MRKVDNFWVANLSFARPVGGLEVATKDKP
jgi:hypothetical protein